MRTFVVDILTAALEPMTGQHVRAEYPVGFRNMKASRLSTRRTRT